jgi:hypothetical protein
MSKQLAISAAFSTFAMAAFALFAAPIAGQGGVHAPREGVATVAIEAQAGPALRLVTLR